MQAYHQAAEDKYSSIREQSLISAKKKLPVYLQDKVNFRAIDNEALLWAAVWEARHRDSWYFSKKYASYARRHPKRLDLAVWHQSYLCSLATGFPVKTGKSMRLDIIESNPDSNPLQHAVFDVNIAAFNIYAGLIGANMMKIMRPLNQKLIDYYRSKGFIYKKSWGSEPEHLWKML